MTVFGATDFNSDKEQAMVKVAPKMYGILKSLSIFNRQIKKVSELMNKVNEIISEVEGTETQSCPITQGKWCIYAVKMVMIGLILITGFTVIKMVALTL